MSGPFAVPVEAGKILAFARAIGDTTADARFAAHGEGAPLLAPPTFLMVADHFDPAFDRRPVWGQPWLGSGATSSGLPPDDPRHTSPFHVEQRFTYARHVQAGDRLTARRLPVRTWTKQGRRAGRLEFVEYVTEFTDDAGAVVGTAAWVDVHTERSHASISAEGAAGQAEVPEAAAVLVEPPAGAVRLVEDLTRTQLVMYVGAAGDFHPLHHDDVYARSRGYPGVFTPGMLTMALTGRAVTGEVGEGTLTRFGGRWRTQVWPGDSLWARVERAGERDSDGVAVVDVTVETVNQHGAVVFDGTATARR